MQTKHQDLDVVSCHFLWFKQSARLIIPAVEKAFVLGVRAIEWVLGIVCDDTLGFEFLTDSIALPAFESAVPIIARLSEKYGICPPDRLKAAAFVDSSGALSVGYLHDLLGAGHRRHCLSTQYACAYMLGRLTIHWNG